MRSTGKRSADYTAQTSAATKARWSTYLLSCVVFGFICSATLSAGVTFAFEPSWYKEDWSMDPEIHALHQKMISADRALDAASNPPWNQAEFARQMVINSTLHEEWRALMQRKASGSAGSATAKSNAPAVGNSTKIASCVSHKKQQGLDEYNRPVCKVAVRNSCKVAVECSADISGTDATGTRHRQRYALHLPAGSSGERGITQVIGCDEPEVSCKPWQQ